MEGITEEQLKANTISRKSYFLNFIIETKKNGGARQKEKKIEKIENTKKNPLKFGQI